MHNEGITGGTVSSGSGLGKLFVRWHLTALHNKYANVFITTHGVNIKYVVKCFLVPAVLLKHSQLFHWG